MEVVAPDYKDSFISHGFLAVDFFFCLSGFVIAYAYDKRIGSIGIGNFFRNRLIRLHPLVVLGGVIGLLGYFYDPFQLHTAPADYNIWLVFLSTILVIPYPVMADRYFNLFGLNAPAWSLFWEYVANILYALVIVRLPRKWVLVLTVISMIWLCAVSAFRGNLLGGWGGETFWDGAARLCFSFLAGVLIFRSNWMIKNRLGFPILALLLGITFFIPYGPWTKWVDPFVAIVYNPLIICLGAGAVLTPRWQKICRFSGDISYPLYMTHYAAIWLFADYLNSRHPGTIEVVIVTTVFTLLLILFSWVVLKWFDQPIRKWLSDRQRSKQVKAVATTVSN
ncbi:putative acyltransferase [Flavihumibacter petaseus NBRC 106054]|uniref:Putative acyltransferase n=2 Tax=Flavihumibacter TaxID=1004301 RepID=A0A0E9MX04_9BACT|nr:putative acyltransferase [Flavihumibacter petaseus NBRC 106054]